MKLTDTTIKTRLLLGFGTILLLVILLGALAFVQTGVIWRDTHYLYSHPFAVNVAVREIETSVMSIHRSMKDVILAENPTELDQAVHRIRIYEADVYRLLDKVYEQYLGKKEDIDDVRGAFIDWTGYYQETIRLRREGRTLEAARRTKSVGARTAETVLKEVKHLKDFAMQRAAAFYTTAENEKRFLDTWLLIAMIVIVSLTVLVGFFIMGGIARPLKELTVVVNRQREGDIDARSAYDSPNEIGELAGAFNRMAESLASQAELREINRDVSESLIVANNLPDFRRNLLKKIIEVTDSQLGVYFLLNPEENIFEPFFSVGVNPEYLRPLSASCLEGEAGKVLATKRISHIKDIPDDTIFSFRTFTGSIAPKEIISIPIILKDVVLGIVSVASVKPYPPMVTATLNQPWSLLVGAVFANLRANDETRQFSEELRDTNQALEAQQVELEVLTEELRKQSEELQVQNVELQQQQLEVEESNRLKSQFLSNMSHELRTPLNSVMALSRVLMMQAKEKLTEEEANYLEIIERNGKNLLSLINDILDLSKIEAGRMDVSPKQFSLSQTLEDIVEGIMPIAREKSIEIRQSIPGDLPLIESDEMRVHQVLQNLIGNAVKFTDTGGVTVSAASDKTSIIIQIADTGIGISETDLPYIFDEFRQVDGTSSRRHDGTGLGLAIAKKVAWMLGGEITVKSAPGSGSTFTLDLPVVWPGTTPVYEPVVMSQAPALRPGSSPRILLVEDNEFAIIQVRVALEHAGYIADVARGGKEALDYVSHTIPDGIVLDLMMPEVDGFDVLEKIRATKATKNIPVLILTAKDLTQHDLSRLSANNIQQLIQKGDVDLYTLLSKIRSMLGIVEEISVPPDVAPAAVLRTTPREAGTATILIIEDNPDNMTTIKAVLHGRYRLLEAADGEEGLRLASQERPDLILLDMALPKTDGFAVVRHLKDDGELGAIPVVAITAQAMKGDKERILEAGCDDYIAKPIDPESFSKKIEELLRNNGKV